jgi:hypothetical protein
MTSNNIKVAYHGKCAFAVCIGKNFVEGKDRHIIMKNGKKYMFSNASVKFLWGLIPSLVKRADKNWAKGS